jgi:hypothetical protein
MPAFPAWTSAPSRTGRSAFIAFLLAVAACGGDGSGSNGGSPTGPTDPPPPPPPTPAISVALSSGSLTVRAGESGSITATVTRTGGFTGAVTISATGDGEGVTATVGASSTSGTTTSAELSVAVAPGAEAGSRSLTVRATGSGVAEATASLGLTITPGDPPAGAAVTLDYSHCPEDIRPVWVAVQDGDGPWTRVEGEGDVYTFVLSADRGGVATVNRPGQGFQTNVQFETRETLSAARRVVCAEADGPPKDHPVSVTGWGEGDMAQVSLGGTTATLFHPTDAGVLAGVRPGSHDLVAWRSHLEGGSPDRGLIRRDVSQASGSPLAVDLEGSEAFDPETATFTVVGAAGDPVIPGMGYLTGPTCESAPLWSAFQPEPLTTFQARGVPGNRQRAGDLHQVFVTAMGGADRTRTVMDHFRVLGSRTLSLGADLPVPTRAGLPGAYLRQRFVFSVPSDYNRVAGFQLLVPGDQRVIVVFASLEWFGAREADLSVPALSGVDGWNDEWAPPPGASGQWVTTAVGNDSVAEDFCREGARVRSATRTGAF